MHVKVNHWNLLKTPINKTKNTARAQQLSVFPPWEQSQICYFTFHAFENQLGPLQTPGDGHLLQTQQKTEQRGWCVENVRCQTKHKTSRRVSMFVERQSDIPVSQVERACVERASEAAEASNCKGLFLLQQLLTNLLVSSTQNRYYRAVWPSVG